MTAYLHGLGLPPVRGVQTPQSPTASWTVNDSNVNIRLAPDAKAAAVGKAQKGDRVSYFGNTNFSVKVGGSWAYSIKVKTKSGLTGWIFGQFLGVPWRGEE